MPHQVHAERIIARDRAEPAFTASGSRSSGKETRRDRVGKALSRRSDCTLQWLKEVEREGDGCHPGAPLVAMPRVVRKAGTPAGKNAAARWERTASAAADRSVARFMQGTCF